MSADCGYTSFPDDTWPAKCVDGYIVNVSVGYRRPCPNCNADARLVGGADTDREAGR